MKDCKRVEAHSFKQFLGGALSTDLLQERAEQMEAICQSWIAALPPLSLDEPVDGPKPLLAFLSRGVDGPGLAATPRREEMSSPPAGFAASAPRKPLEDGASPSASPSAMMRHDDGSHRSLSAASDGAPAEAGTPREGDATQREDDAGPVGAAAAKVTTRPSPYPTAPPADDADDAAPSDAPMELEAELAAATMRDEAVDKVGHGGGGGGGAVASWSVSFVWAALVLLPLLAIFAKEGLGYYKTSDGLEQTWPRGAELRSDGPLDMNSLGAGKPEQQQQAVPTAAGAVLEAALQEAVANMTSTQTATLS